MCFFHSGCVSCLSSYSRLTWWGADLFSSSQPCETVIRESVGTEKKPQHRRKMLISDSERLLIKCHQIWASPLSLFTTKWLEYFFVSRSRGWWRALAAFCMCVWGLACCPVSGVPAKGICYWAESLFALTENCDISIRSSYHKSIWAMYKSQFIFN